MDETKKIRKAKVATEVKCVAELLYEAEEKYTTFNYTLEVRNGQVKRTVFSEVYNGTDFDEN